MNVSSERGRALLIDGRAPGVSFHVQGDPHDGEGSSVFARGHRPRARRLGVMQSAGLSDGRDPGAGLSNRGFPSPYRKTVEKRTFKRSLWSNS